MEDTFLFFIRYLDFGVYVFIVIYAWYYGMGTRIVYKGIHPPILLIRPFNLIKIVLYVHKVAHTSGFFYTSCKLIIKNGWYEPYHMVKKYVYYWKIVKTTTTNVGWIDAFCFETMGPTGQRAYGSLFLNPLIDDVADWDLVHSFVCNVNILCCSQKP